MNDSYRHKGLRRQLIEEIRAKGIKDESVLDAMSILPRHFFLEKAFEEHAYADKAFPIGNDQTISQPYTVAYMTSLLDIKKGDKVLEIGTGSGYQAAVLATLGARVYTVERQEELYKKTKELLKKMDFNTLRCFFGDGSVGLSDYAPYDKIIVTAGALIIPDALKEQLSINGVLVIPVGENDGQRMYHIKRISDIEYESKALDKFRFVPFLSGLNKMK
jgi:protein-L-isoaspartate(D-aspartate) O-methyltransferase